MKSKGNKELFVFKEFEVDQRDCGMRISEDAILLGAWADFSSCFHVLDLGCGTGILSLMLAQRFPQLHITSIDIDSGAAKRARENAKNSPFSSRIQVMQKDFFELSESELNNYDAIICNPPFFADGERSSDEARKTARHQDQFDLERLFSVVSKKKSIKKMAMIFPSKRPFPLFQADLKLGQRVWIQADQQKAVHRQLLLWNRENPALDEAKLVVRKDGQYTTEFKQLCKAFYLDL